MAQCQDVARCPHQMAIAPIRSTPATGDDASRRLLLTRFPYRWTQACKLWPQNSGRGLWHSNSGTQTVALKLWPSNSGPQTPAFSRWHSTSKSQTNSLNLTPQSHGLNLTPPISGLKQWPQTPAMNFRQRHSDSDIQAPHLGQPSGTNIPAPAPLRPIQRPPMRPPQNRPRPPNAPQFPPGISPLAARKTSPPRPRRCAGNGGKTAQHRGAADSRLPQEQRMPCRFL